MKITTEIRSLLGTVMIIQETFDDWVFGQWTNPYKVDRIQPEARRALFIDWAVEFKNKYKDTKEYEDEFFETCKEFAERKIEEKFV